MENKESVENAQAKQSTIDMSGLATKADLMSLKCDMNDKISLVSKEITQLGKEISEKFTVLGKEVNERFHKVDEKIHDLDLNLQSVKDKIGATKWFIVVFTPMALTVVLFLADRFWK